LSYHAKPSQNNQGLFLLLFLFLFIQTETKGNDELGVPVRLFLDFDPLILVTTLLSAHAASVGSSSLDHDRPDDAARPRFLRLGLPAWTLNNLVGSLRKTKASEKPRDWHRVKYFILIGIIASSVFSLQPVGIMDPLSLLIRSFSVSIFPWFNYAVRSTFDTIYAANPLGIAAVSEPVYSVLKKTVMTFEQAHYRQSVFIGVLFLTVLGLNLVEKRFWCKYLCPLGALLGLLSRFSLLKRSVSEGCTECGACARVCQGAAQPMKRASGRTRSATTAGTATTSVRTTLLPSGFAGKKLTPAMDLGRRRIIVSALTVSQQSRSAHRRRLHGQCQES